MVLAQFAMFPTDKGESVSEYVSKVIDVIHESGIKYKLTAMSTILEGEWDEVFGVITKCYKTLEPISNRIYSVVTVDYRKGGESRMKSKTDKIKNVLDKDIDTA